MGGYIARVSQLQLKWVYLNLVCVDTYMHAFIYARGTNLHIFIHPPTHPIYPPTPVGIKWLKWNYSWTNQDNFILFTDLWPVEMSPCTHHPLVTLIQLFDISTIDILCITAHFGDSFDIWFYLNQLNLLQGYFHVPLPWVQNYLNENFVVLHTTAHATFSLHGYHIHVLRIKQLSHGYCLHLPF